MMRSAVVATFVAAVVTTIGATTQTNPASPATRVVLLGTGTPRPDPARSGPATAIVTNDAAYLVDAGPGIVRRAAAAAAKGITALSVEKLQTLFITHLHSDHTVGLPDLIFTPWVQGRQEALRVFGPKGTEDMTRYILLAWKKDIDIRTQGLERRSRLAVQAHDVKPGVVFKDASVTVTAFQNAHGEWDETFGYKFQTADRTIVVSGDTNPSEALIAACQKCDVLIHEVYSENFVPADMPNWIEYRGKYHTTIPQLAEIAARTQPRLLILYHRGPGSAESYIAGIHRRFSGVVVDGEDLGVY
jgi:ribonuclease BN (tRNA processing enzyme)